jgi:hypothetical protein
MKGLNISPYKPNTPKIGVCPCKCELPPGLRGCAHAHKRREGLKERERDKQRKKKKGQNLQLPLLCSCRLLFFFCQDVAFLDFFVWWCSCLTMSGAFQLQQLSRVGSPHASTHM